MKLFVYGTLRSNGVMKSVLQTEETKERTPVILQGFRKNGLNILEDQDESVEGDVVEVNEDEMKLLDNYESVSSGVYRRIKVNIGDESITAYQIV